VLFESVQEGVVTARRAKGIYQGSGLLARWQIIQVTHACVSFTCLFECVKRTLPWEAQYCVNAPWGAPGYRPS
jgi:hypothetical protein